ncbi:Glycosyltransferase involved in cell wall bisynthesis [Singulisphaera sp. GP187]|uniref:glycosyltransferase n=1 Tax=Singulisphaera sp. GP187 TaxID=1882752 RepID=UPI0009280962|nr:glycosyltransferase [Singulisphaera sp. GP187]SIO61477.1 Glycosyltransferase involved in cell wall bisynthesis [Singulisphaera sp. GP187]
MSDRRLTVCQLLLTLQFGGAEIMAARIARRLSGPHRIIFACLEELGQLGEQLRADGFPVQVLGKRPGVDLRAAHRLRRLLHRERVDLIHAHQYGPFFYAALSRLPSGRLPVVLTEHGRSFPDPARPSHVLANPWLLRRHDRLFAVGRSVRQALIEVEGFPAARIELIYNGIDTDAFAETARGRAIVRRELGIADDDFVVVQAARLDPIKDHATALRAAGRVAGQCGCLRLVIVGDGPEAGPIEAMVRDWGLGTHVLRLGLRRDIPRLLGAADAVLLSSLSEGIPLSLIEGMAASLPVVATRVGGVSEVVVEQETGLLAPAGDDEALAAHLIRLAGDPGLRMRMGWAGRERAWALFSEDRMVAEYDRIYHEVTTRTASGVWQGQTSTARGA